MSDADRKPGFYWIRNPHDAIPEWEPARWSPDGWEEGTAGLWWCLGTEIPLYHLEELARVEVGARIEVMR